MREAQYTAKLMKSHGANSSSVCVCVQFCKEMHKNYDLFDSLLQCCTLYSMLQHNLYDSSKYGLSCCTKAPFYYYEHGAFFEDLDNLAPAVAVLAFFFIA